MNTILNKLSGINLEVKRISEEVISFLVANGQNPPVEDIDTIRIALFGQFNSGKSTLVNALLGERVAVSGDAPETKVPHIYKWEGLEIVDLPGVDARMEEEKEALEALKQSHVVLYVISSVTGLDYDSIWTDLGKLSKNGIPFLIVINDKKAHQDAVSEQDFQQKLLMHFCELASSRLPDQNWTNRIFWVNAKLAEKGRLEKKHRLYERSGMQPLEHRIVEVIHEGRLIIENTAYLRKLQEYLKKLIISLTQEENSIEIKQIKEALENCEMVKARLEAVANNYAEKLTALKDIIYSNLAEAIFNKHKNKNITEKDLQPIFEEIWDNFLKRCEVEFKNLEVQIGLKSDSSQLVFDSDKNIYDKNESNDETRNTSYTNNEPNYLEGLGLIITLHQMTRPEFVQRLVYDACNAVETALDKVIDITVDGICNLIDKIGSVIDKASGSSASSKLGEQIATQGSKIAGTAGAKAGGGALAAKESAAATAGKGATTSWGRFLGPIVTLVFAAYQIHKGFKNVEMEREKRSILLKECECKAQTIVENAKDKFITNACVLVNDAIRPIKKQLYDRLRSYEQSERNIRSNLLRAHELSDHLDNLIQNMTRDLNQMKTLDSL